MRILIAAGGTAGHVVPALAVADALSAEGAEVTFVGGERAEKTLVPQAGYPLAPLGAVAGLDRAQPAEGRARRAARARRRAHGVAAALARCGPPRSSAAAATSPGRSGWRPCCGACPLVLTEADSHLGLTNRLLAPFARRVCLAFDLPGREPPRYRVTGRPGPPPATDRAKARARFDLHEHETCVLVFGGSLGARSINEAAVEAFAGADFRVLHACGERDYAALKERVARDRATTCGPTSTSSARRCWPPTWWSRAAAGRSSRSPRTGARPC